MIRLALLATLLAGVAGCAGVPAAVIWTTVGAGLGVADKALNLDREIVRYLEGRPKAQSDDDIQL